MDDLQPTVQCPTLSRRLCLVLALFNAQAAVDALKRDEPLAADIYLKLAGDYIRESGVLP